MFSLAWTCLCPNDEQNRLVFKTPTWLKTFIHAWLSDPIPFSRFDIILTSPTSGESLPCIHVNIISQFSCHLLIILTGGKHLFLHVTRMTRTLYHSRIARQATTFRRWLYLSTPSDPSLRCPWPLSLKILICFFLFREKSFKLDSALGWS